MMQDLYLKNLTSIGLGGKVLDLIELDINSDFARLEDLKKNGAVLKNLGNGTNILASDNDLNYVLLKPKYSDDIRIIAENDNSVIIQIDAGLNLARLVSYSVKKGLKGLEGLGGVPGQIGGALAMNAGSYGCEIGSLIKNVKVFSFKYGIADYSLSELELDYRSFKIKALKDEFLFILGANLEFQKADSDELYTVLKENLQKKKATQPITAKSGGCLFKNPPNNSAGKLLDLSGLKGFELGGMALSSMHANFLVNTGNGTSAQAFELIEIAKEKVAMKFNIDLHEELIIWSED